MYACVHFLNIWQTLLDKNELVDASNVLLNMVHTLEVRLITISFHVFARSVLVYCAYLNYSLDRNNKMDCSRT